MAACGGWWSCPWAWPPSRWPCSGGAACPASWAQLLACARGGNGRSLPPAPEPHNYGQRRAAAAPALVGNGLLLGHQAVSWQLSDGGESVLGWRGKSTVFQGHLSGSGAAEQPGMVVVFERSERDEFCAARCILCSGPEDTGSEDTSTDEGCPRPSGGQRVAWTGSSFWGNSISLRRSYSVFKRVVSQHTTRAYIKSIDINACCTRSDLWFCIFLATRV